MKPTQNVIDSLTASPPKLVSGNLVVSHKRSLIMRSPIDGTSDIGIIDEGALGIVIGVHKDSWPIDGWSSWWLLLLSSSYVGWVRAEHFEMVM